MGLPPTMAPPAPFVQSPWFACRINQLLARKKWPCGEATYDGSLFLRRLIDLGANARFLRPALGPLIAKFVMLELISEKI